jgi:hypothetical protein
MRRDQKKHVPFLSELFGLTLVLAVLIRVLISWDFFATYQPFVWASLVFLALTTIGVYFIMLRAMAMQTHTNFVIAFGTGFAIKSFASLAFICYFIFFRPIADHRFVFPFFIMYFAYTALLIWDIWQSSKRKPLP